MLACRTVVFLTITYGCLSLWTQGSNQLPRAGDEMALGYDTTTGTILLFGGSEKNNYQQFVTFKNHQFNDVNISYLTTAQQTKSAGQHYTQLENYLWFISINGSKIININTETYNVSDAFINIPFSTSIGGCLTSIPGFLIVIGGGEWHNSPHNKVQIYDIDAEQWLSSVPSLTNMRMSAACAVVEDKVYAIGGYDYGAYLDSIEEFDASNLPNTAGIIWETLSSKLASGRSGHRAVTHSTDIYVIGGDNGTSWLDDVNIIDTVSNSCQIIDTLAFATSYAASIIVDNLIYTFGGWLDNPSGLTAEYQYSTLIPDSPTASPITFAPTKYPSKAPTKHPSKAPSKYSTKAPSKNPSKYPSLIASGIKLEFIISITLIACDGNCVITEDKINDMLIAHLDPDVEILRTEIVDNTVVVFIVADASTQLDKDVIAASFEAEYGEVEVVIEEHQDEDSSDVQNDPKHNRITSSLFLWGTISSTLLGTVLICVFCRYFRKRKSAKRHAYMIEMPKKVNRVKPSLDGGVAIENNVRKNQTEVKSGEESVSLTAGSGINGVSQVIAKCVHCGDVKTGKMYENAFYCNECRHFYEAEIELNHMETDGNNTHESVVLEEGEFIIDDEEAHTEDNNAKVTDCMP